MNIDRIRSRRRLPWEVKYCDGGQFDFLVVIDVTMTEAEYKEYSKKKANIFEELFK